MSFWTECLSFIATGNAQYGVEDTYCPKCNWKGSDRLNSSHRCPRCNTFTKMH